jgi:hypothetical protein
MRKTDSGLSIIYFLSIYKEEIGDLFGEIKKMAMEAGVISLTQERPSDRLRTSSPNWG